MDDRIKKFLLDQVSNRELDMSDLIDLLGRKKALKQHLKESIQKNRSNIEIINEQIEKLKQAKIDIKSDLDEIDALIELL
jgi:hypothetical protein